LKKNTYKYWSQGIIKKKIMILEKDFQLMEQRLVDIKPSPANNESQF